ncbi:putative protein phosphatase 2C 43-like [Dorcoceras hygrometricum]|uniref:Uncharacterized protein n=1 Tax=Dorcoceras hygrometricum TaxID=472368 RepID=A0A2Z7C7Q2_9LAMI|nr:putative protein phosphatase 2C 43-like [Dorcoceras hygrometricum]
MSTLSGESQRFGLTTEGRLLVNPAELTAGVVAQNSCCYCKRFVPLWGNSGRYIILDSAVGRFEKDLFSAVGCCGVVSISWYGVVSCCVIEEQRLLVSAVPVEKKRRIQFYCSSEHFFPRFLSIPAVVLNDIGGADLPEFISELEMNSFVRYLNRFKALRGICRGCRSQEESVLLRPRVCRGW